MAAGVRRALGVLVAAVVAGAAQGCARSCVYTLWKPLPFAGGQVTGCVSPPQLMALQGREVVSPDVGSEGYRFLSLAGGGRVATRTCGEYFDAVGRGAFAVTSRDMALEGEFVEACGALAALRQAAVPVSDFLGGGELDTARLPVALLPAMQEDDWRRLLEESGRGQTLADRIAQGAAVLQQAPRLLSVRSEGYVVELEAVARGDFNRDGYADLLVMSRSRAEEGTHAGRQWLLFTRTAGEQAMFEAWGGGFRCGYAEARYACAEEAGWSPY